MDYPFLAAFFVCLFPRNEFLPKVIGSFCWFGWIFLFLMKNDFHMQKSVHGLHVARNKTIYFLCIASPERIYLFGMSWDCLLSYHSLKE